MSDFVTVVTTIQSPTHAMSALNNVMTDSGAKLIVVGDAKSPPVYRLPGCEFLSLDRQSKRMDALTGLLPTNHYARKNVGYLHAIEGGAKCIYETDDDNAPLQNFAPRNRRVDARSIKDAGWVNVYRYFSDSRIWPRGFPLDAISKSFGDSVNVDNTIAVVDAPIQQGLAKGSPDVDAIWRLVLDEEPEFREEPAIALPKGAVCPFNSQSTWWWPPVFPLLYLPSYCPFRMTDIWRSFVAQRCLWEMGGMLVFHAPEVWQSRNDHDLMKDFEDEIKGYRQNRAIMKILEDVELASGAQMAKENLRRCYAVLVQQSIFPPEELDLVSSWLEALEVALDGAA